MLDKHIVYLLMICSKQQQQQQLEEQMQSVKNGNKKQRNRLLRDFWMIKQQAFFNWVLKSLLILYWIVFKRCNGLAKLGYNPRMFRIHTLKKFHPCFWFCFHFFFIIYFLKKCLSLSHVQKQTHTSCTQRLLGIARIVLKAFIWAGSVVLCQSRRLMQVPSCFHHLSVFSRRISCVYSGLLYLPAHAVWQRNCSAGNGKAGGLRAARCVSACDI